MSESVGGTRPDTSPTLAADRATPGRHEEADDWWLVRALPALLFGAGLVAVAGAALLASHAGISHRAREVISVGRFEITLIYTVPSLEMVMAGLLTALALVLLVHGVEGWASRRITEPARQSREALERPLRKEALPTDWVGLLSVTALIPANNEEAHLPGTLNSLQDQTMPPTSIWVIADNCTDRTADVARAHGANVYTTINNHHRKAGGLNQLLERLLPAMGAHDVVLVMDADTVMVDDFLEKAIAEFAATPELSAVGGMFYGDDSAPGLRAQLQRNEYRRYAREIGRRKGKVFVLTGTASLFRADAFKAVAASRGSVLPGEQGQVYDTISLTEDNELTLALKTLGARLISPQGCQVRTELMPTWHDLWNQRQRWQRGALENIGMYGMTSATARYWLQQFGLGYGVLALAAYLALTILGYVAFGLLTVVLFWALFGLLFAVERTVTVWHGGWRARLLAAPLVIELGYAIFLQAVYVKSLLDIGTGRSKHWNAAKVQGSVA